MPMIKVQSQSYKKHNSDLSVTKELLRHKLSNLQKQERKNSLLRQGNCKLSAVIGAGYYYLDKPDTVDLVTYVFNEHPEYTEAGFDLMQTATGVMGLKAAALMGACYWLGTYALFRIPFKHNAMRKIRFTQAELDSLNQQNKRTS
jgi:hypothetical protein